MTSRPLVPPRSGQPPRQLVVLLHGYGADGADLIGLAGPLGEALPHAAFAAPDAPGTCAANPAGFEWFPLDLSDLEGCLRTGLPVARRALLAGLERVWADTGLGLGRTFICGFSQGAMTALSVGLSLPEAPLGIVSFAGALHAPEGFGAPGAARPPVCLVHGDLDDVVDPALTHAAAARLAAAGYPVALHVSAGAAHVIAADGLAFAAAFMRDRAAERA